MKKTLFVIALVVLALGAFGVGTVLAQGRQNPVGGSMHTYMIAAFAEKLGLTVDEVNTRLTAGESMYEIALAEGIKAEDFTTFMTDVRTKALAAAVKDGVITQEQADWMNSHNMGRMMGGQYGNGTGTCPMQNGGTGFNGQRGPGMMNGWRQP